LGGKGGFKPPSLTAIALKSQQLQQQASGQSSAAEKKELENFLADHGAQAEVSLTHIVILL
jgi:hypothetical protein